MKTLTGEELEEAALSYEEALERGKSGLALGLWDILYEQEFQNYLVLWRKREQIEGTREEMFREGLKEHYRDFSDENNRKLKACIDKLNKLSQEYFWLLELRREENDR